MCRVKRKKMAQLNALEYVSGGVVCGVPEGTLPPASSRLGAPAKERFPLGRTAPAAVGVVQLVVGAAGATAAGRVAAPLEIAAQRRIVAGVPLTAEEPAPVEQVGERDQHQQPGNGGDEDDPPRHVHRDDRRPHLRERFRAHGQAGWLVRLVEQLVDALDDEPGARPDPHHVDLRVIAHERGVPEPRGHGDEGVRFRPEIVYLAHDPHALGRLAGTVHLDGAVAGLRAQHHRSVAAHAARPGVVGAAQRRERAGRRARPGAAG